ncbi:FAD-linked oxidase C-terminal domain-containing protein [Bdellovibrionota bacterium]
MKTYDFLIIGSGFGGSVSAMRLAQKGYKVAVLESGKRYRAKDFPLTNWNVRKFLWAPKLRCFGFQRLSFLKGMLLIHGAGVGGGSLVYANVLVPPQNQAYDDPAWPKGIDWRSELSPYFETAKKMLGVTTNEGLEECDEVLRKAGEKLGVGDTFYPTEVGVYFGKPDVTVSDPFFGGDGPARTGCNLCGGCMVGCRYHAKNTLDYNYLYFAEAWGAEVFPETKATRITPVEEGYEVETVHSTKFFRPKGETFRAKKVIVAAGTLGTLQLLLENRDRLKTLPNISPRLGDNVRTNGESLCGATTFDKDRDLSKGIAIGSAIHPDEETMIEAVRYPKKSSVMKFLSVPLTANGNWFTRPLKLVWTIICDLPRALRLFVIRDWAKSSIILLVMRTVDQKMKIRIGRTLHRGFFRGLKGFQERLPSYVPVAQKATIAAAEAIDGVPQNSIAEVVGRTLTTAHILGGTCLSDNAEEGVVDFNHQVHGHPGLYVCDGGVIPANLGANPSLTITALSERFANQFPVHPDLPKKIEEERVQFKIDSQSRREMKWFGWGDPKVHFELPDNERVEKYLSEKFGLSELKEEKTDWNIEDVKVNESALSSEIISAIEQEIGKGAFSVEKNDRLIHAYGKSYKDLIRIRALNVQNAPDVVFYPSNEEEINKILNLCSKNNIAIVPFSGGTDVVSGLDAEKGGKQFVASLDLTRLNKVLGLDETAHTITVEAGMYGVDLEKLLNSRGFTLGHFPQSFEYTTVGGWVATRAAGQNSTRYGKIEDIVVSLKMITPTGVIETAKAPAMACGPDMKQLLVGSEGVFGIISTCTLRVHALPETRDYFALLFPSFEKAAEASRLILQNGMKPAMVRVSDAEETEMMMAMRSKSTGFKKFVSFFVSKHLQKKGYKIPGSSIMMIGLEGSARDNCNDRRRLRTILKGTQYFNLGRSAGKSWLKDRFAQPYLRDRLLDNQMLVDTLETATTWDNIPELYNATCTAIKEACNKQGVNVGVYTHISHLYEVGASLYFIIAANQTQSDPLKQWEEMKAAASNAIVKHSGVISHHHGIGIDHKSYLKRSECELAVLRSVKKQLDPDGIMNPGKVFDI